MIGNFGKSKYKCVQDFNTLNDFAEYMYSNTNGYIYSCIKYNNNGNEIFSSRAVSLKRINLSDLSNTIFSDVLDGQAQDRYITLNTFCKKKTSPLSRKVENSKRLNAFYVDIDCYKMGLSQDAVIYELTNNLNDYAIPHWTFLMKSGRGVYVIWKLRNEDGYIDAVKNKWKVVEDYLCNQLSDLGADKNATDIARVLRVPFSYNAKNGKMVSIVDFCDVDYSIYDIMTEYCPVNLYHTDKSKAIKEKKITPKMKCCADAIAKALGVVSPCNGKDADFGTVWSFINDNKSLIRNSHGELKSYKAKYCAKNADDIIKLMALRKGKENGYREVALFLIRTMLLKATEDTSYALETTLKVNQTFAKPLDEKTVIEATKSAERYYKSRYNYSRAKIAEMLNISESECKALCFRCGDKCVNRKESNQKYYLSILEKKNDKPKKLKIADRRNKINDLVSDGLCCDAICDMLNISKATLYRDMAFLGISFASDTDSDMHNDDNKNEKGIVKIGFKMPIFRHSHFLRLSIIKGNYVPCLSRFARVFFFPCFLIPP